MSGPKVVRVITREELLADAEQVLAQLEQRLAQWQQGAERLEELDAAHIQQAKDRFDRLVELLRADRFGEFTKGARREIAFLQADLEKRRQAAAKKEALRLTTALRQREAATSLLKKMSHVPGPLDAELLSSLKLIAEGRNPAQTGAIIARGFSAIAPSGESAPVSSAQREAAQRLKQGLPGQTFEQWKLKQESTEAPGRFDYLAQQLAILGAFDEGTQVEHFGARLADLQHAEGNTRRQLLMDSLLIEVRQAIDTARTRIALEQQAGDVLAQLQALKQGSAHDIAQVRKQSEDLSGHLRHLKEGLHGDTEALQSLIAEAQQHLQMASRTAAARSRRKAVLQALGRLGYDVREDMDLMWSDNGRLVLQRSLDEQYGVELATGGDAERIQVRTVKFGADTDRAADVDAETRWCSEFNGLKEDLARHGSDLTIDRAEAVGAVPVRVVQREREDVRSREMMRPRIRKA